MNTIERKNHREKYFNKTILETYSREISIAKKLLEREQTINKTH